MPSSTDLLHPDFRTDPYWWDAAPPEAAGEDLPATVDVAIVGSGYCGLSAAAVLAEGGARVVVLDAGPLGAGASTRSGGMVSSGQKLVAGGAIKGVPSELFARMIEDSVASFAHLRDLVAAESLDADLQLFGRFFGAHTPAAFDRLREMGRILGERTGVTVHEVPRERQRAVVGSDGFRGGIVVDEYGGLHPGKYHRALRRRAAARGALLRSHAPVRRIDGTRGALTVRTDRGEIRAGEVVIATNGYTGSATPDLARRVVPVRSHQIATEPLPPGLMAELNPGRRMISDTKRELFYTRPSPDGTRMLFGARPSWRPRSDRDAVPSLHRQMCRVWPQLREVRVTHAWSGFVAMTFDKTAHMGERDGVHYALGCNGNGVALMTYLGHQTGLKLLGRQNRPCAFDQPAFPTRTGYAGSPWFLPLVSAYYHARDKVDLLLAR